MLLAPTNTAGTDVELVLHAAVTHLALYVGLAGTLARVQVTLQAGRAKRVTLTVTTTRRREPKVIIL